MHSVARWRTRCTPAASQPHNVSLGAYYFRCRLISAFVTDRTGLTVYLLATMPSYIVVVSNGLITLRWIRVLEDQPFYLKNDGGKGGWSQTRRGSISWIFDATATPAILLTVPWNIKQGLLASLSIVLVFIRCCSKNNDDALTRLLPVCFK